MTSRTWERALTSSKVVSFSRSIWLSNSRWRVVFSSWYALAVMPTLRGVVHTPLPTRISGPKVLVFAIYFPCLSSKQTKQLAARRPVLGLQRGFFAHQPIGPGVEGIRQVGLPAAIDGRARVDGANDLGIVVRHPHRNMPPQRRFNLAIVQRVLARVPVQHNVDVLTG